MILLDTDCIPNISCRYALGIMKEDTISQVPVSLRRLATPLPYYMGGYYNFTNNLVNVFTHQRP